MSLDFFTDRGATFDRTATPNEQGWLTGQCPVHGALTVNSQNGLWVCVETKAKGRQHEFAGHLGGAPPETPPEPKPPPQKRTAIPLDRLSKIDDPALHGKKVQVAFVALSEGQVYHAVRSFHVESCPDWNPGENTPKCEECKGRKFSFPRAHPAYVSACRNQEAKMLGVCRQFACPYAGPRQRKGRIKVDARSSVREFHVTECPDVRETEQLVDRRVYAHVPPGQSLRVRPRQYLAEGWVLTHPATNETTLLIDQLEEQHEPYERFQWKEHVPALQAVRELGVGGLRNYIAAHVAHLAEADELIMAMLMCFCSPRWIEFNGERIRGWLNVCCIGDTATGKSVTFESLARWLGAGHVFSALTGTRSGLTHAIPPNQRDRARVQWGLYPRASGTIVCAEEVQALAQQKGDGRYQINALAMAMDQGTLKVDMVASAACECQTRIMFLCNPVDGSTLASYGQGCLAAKELFIPMFLRRLDLALFLRRIADDAVYNRAYEAAGQDAVTREMFQALVYYAWTIAPERIVITPEATQSILSHAQALGQRFGQTDDVPLVLPADFRKKLARLSASFALLSLSSHDRFETVQVEPQHVNFVASFVSTHYSSDACQLDIHSNQAKQQNGLSDYDVVSKIFRAHFEAGLETELSSENSFVIVLRMLRSTPVVYRRDLARIEQCDTEFVQSTFALLERYSLSERLTRTGDRLTSRGHTFINRFWKDHPEWKAVVEPEGESQ